MRRAIRVGDIVREHEGRHLGTVVGVFGGVSRDIATVINVRWHDARNGKPTRWRSSYDASDLVIVERAHTLPVYNARQAWLWEGKR